MKIDLIIKLQQKFKTLKLEIIKLNDLISFQREYLISMINNLSLLNNLKLYQDTDSLFLTIINELVLIKNEINKYSEIISIKNFKENYNKSIEINDLLIKYSNHIVPDDINFIFKLFINNNWINDLSIEDSELIFFITKFVKPILIWDSEYHKKNVEYIKNDNESIKTKSFSITKEIFETLLKLIPKTSISNEIIIPPFFKSNIELEIKQIHKQNNIFSNIDCLNVLSNNNIKVLKNNKSYTLIEDKNGVNIYLKVNNKFIIIQGIFKDDLLNISYNINFIKNKLSIHKNLLFNNSLTIPSYFKENYLKILSVRDIITMETFEIIEEINKKYNDFKVIQGKPLITLINEFLLASKYRKIDILTLLLMSNTDDQQLAYILYDVFKAKDKKDISTEIYNSLHYSIRFVLDETKEQIENTEENLMRITENDIPYERRISLLKTSEDVKVKAIEKLKAMKSSFQGDAKAQSWIDGLLKIPFGVYNKNEIISFKSDFINKISSLDNNLKLFSDNDIDYYISSLDESNILKSEWNNYKIEKVKYLKEVRSVLDTTVYGHHEAKNQLERLFAQWINGESKGEILGLQGPPGTGKTSLAKNGLANCLKDKSGKPRPFIFLPIGGSVNGSTLVGHNFTYVGSTWGRIVDILMVSKCMNPIIFIDEIDKVSHTEHGREIISILTHLTDSTQNDEFEDKFFAGVKLDLSKALIVFSFNDPDLIDPILRDRITIIETHALSIKDKLIIIQNYMFPEICKEVGFNPNEIIFNEEIITYIIETFTNEAGVRKIKEKIIEIIRDINLNRFYNADEYKIPFIITLDYIKNLFENKPKIRTKKIAPEPTVGLVNGLYATSSGLGGLTIIQLTRFPSDKMLDLQLTGKAGDVMKESVQYSLKVAWSLLSIEEQNKIIEGVKFGIHIHCPDGATPKDGPSAGAAFTLAIYSVLTNKKINNKICMTGEIDLVGNVTAIGGIESKLHGGKKAGCTIALIPQENWQDLEILRKKGKSPEDDIFKVYPIDNIKQVIEYAII
jgi:ATP-dependent Lon protease